MTERLPIFERVAGELRAKRRLHYDPPTVQFSLPDLEEGYAPVNEPQSGPPITTGIRFPRAGGTSYLARDVARAYGAPIEDYDGRGVTVGIIELGGGYDPQDMAQAGLVDNVTVVGVDGGRSQSDGPNGADGEVALDVQVVAGVAPGAAIRLYFAPNSDAGFIDATAQAASECDVISISWGGPENSWSSSAIKKFSAVFASARAAGIPVFVASGDTGSTDGTGANVTDYPASDPSVIGCGGTRLTLDASGARQAEVTWNDSPTQSATGGGVSKVFPGRQVPDVAGNADPVTGYRTEVDGDLYVIGGTSAVAPLYAGCYALALQSYGSRFDLLNTILTNPAVCFDVTEGNNGGYKAGPGRDMTTGYGVVDWGRLLAVLNSGTQVPAPGGGDPTPPPDPTGGGDPTPPPDPTGGGDPTPPPDPTPTPQPSGCLSFLFKLRHEIDHEIGHMGGSGGGKHR